MSDETGAPDHEPLLTNGHVRVRRCRHGVMLYNLNDMYLGTMLDRYGEFSEGEAELFARVLRPGMTVVEVGANIGAHTVTLAQAVGPTGRVLAFEPQRAVFQMLCANLALNGLDYVEPHWAAAGSAPGVITVPRLDSRARQNFGGLSIAGAQQGDQVRLVTLDGFALPACHLLKIDVEGMEAEVLRGARETIARHRPLIYAENDRADRSAELIGLLQELDYRCFWHAPPYVRIPNFRGNTANDFQGLVSINLFCAPRSLAMTVVGAREVQGPQDTWDASPPSG